MKKSGFTKKEAPGTRKNEVILLAGIVLALIALIVLGFLGLLPHRSSDASDVGHLKKVANLAALPPRYRVATGEDMTNARSLWVEDSNAPRNSAKVLVTIIDRTDPSAKHIDAYYANHYGEKCRNEKDHVLLSRGREIHVKRSICGGGEDTLKDAQAVFHISEAYAVSVYERSGPAQFNNAAFAAVVNTVLQSNESDEVPG